jgi:hypothetical protein
MYGFYPLDDKMTTTAPRIYHFKKEKRHRSVLGAYVFSLRKHCFSTSCIQLTSTNTSLARTWSYGHASNQENPENGELFVLGLTAWGLNSGLHTWQIGSVCYFLR